MQIWNLSIDELKRIDFLSVNQWKKLFDLFCTSLKLNLESIWQQVSIYDFAVSVWFIGQERGLHEMSEYMEISKNQQWIDRADCDWNWEKILKVQINTNQIIFSEGILIDDKNNLKM